jgi:hypothetical protein
LCTVAKKTQLLPKATEDRRSAGNSQGNEQNAMRTPQAKPYPEAPESGQFMAPFFKKIVGGPISGVRRLCNEFN